MGRPSRRALSAIAELLTTDPIDILAFHAVCKSWHSSSPSPDPFNFSILLPMTATKPEKDCDMRFYGYDPGLPIISVTAVFAVDYHGHDQEPNPKTWLLFADQLTPGKLIIRKPFTKCCYSMPFNFPTYSDVPNVRVREVARFFNLSFQTAVKLPPTMWSKYTHKVVLSDDESAAFALFSSGKLGRCGFRLVDHWGCGSWKPVNSVFEDDGESRFDDVVCYKGRILSVDRIARVYDVGNVIDETRRIVPGVAGCGTKRKRLVVSKGCLYLVTKCNVDEDRDRNVRFRVYVLVEELKHWVEVNSLGDQVFCFGLDFSFSAAPQEMGGSFGMNCIVFKSGSFKNIKGDDVDGNYDYFDKDTRSEDLDVGVWHMRSKQRRFNWITSWVC